MTIEEAPRHFRETPNPPRTNSALDDPRHQAAMKYISDIKNDYATHQMSTEQYLTELLLVMDRYNNDDLIAAADLLTALHDSTMYGACRILAALDPTSHHLVFRVENDPEPTVWVLLYDEDHQPINPHTTNPVLGEQRNLIPAVLEVLLLHPTLYPVTMSVQRVMQEMGMQPGLMFADIARGCHEPQETLIELAQQMQ